MGTNVIKFFDVVDEYYDIENRYAYAKYDDAVAFAKEAYIESLATSCIRIEESEPTEVDESKGLYYVEDKFHIRIEERILKNEKSKGKDSDTLFQDVLVENLKDRTEDRHAYANQDDAVAFAKAACIESLDGRDFSDLTIANEGQFYLEDEFFINVEERILNMPHTHQRKDKR